MSEQVLSLDISTWVGWAHDAPDGYTPTCGTFGLPATAAGANGIRFSAFRKWLVRKIDEIKPVLVTYEAPMHIAGGHSSTRKTQQSIVVLLIGLVAIVDEVCATMGVACFTVNIMTAKKYLTGDGHADKRAMIHRCKVFGWPVSDDHQADACAIWSYSKTSRDPKWGPRATPLFARATPPGA